MTDQYLPPAPDQHDTSAYARPLPPSGSGYATTDTGWQVPSQPVLGINPEADYWAARYRSQRTWTRVLAVGVGIALVGVLGTGIVVARMATSNPVLAAASDLADGDLSGDGLLPNGATPDGTQPEESLPEESLPENTLPEGTAPQDAEPGTPDVPLSELPLPESVQDLAAFLGITDVGQILDLAVANGMMSQEDADKVRAALTIGAAVPGLLGDDAATSDSDPSAQL